MSKIWNFSSSIIIFCWVVSDKKSIERKKDDLSSMWMGEIWHIYAYAFNLTNEKFLLTKNAKEKIGWFVIFQLK